MLLDYRYADLLGFAQRIYGNKQDGSPRRLQMTQMSYPMNFGTVAANATVTKRLQFDANADFILINISANTVDEGPPIGKVLFSDAATQLPYSNGPVSSLAQCNLLMGFAYPRFIEGRSSVLGVYQQTSGNEEMEVQFSFNGVLVRAMD